MSIINPAQKKRGRPSVDSEEVKVRIERNLLNSIDAWRGNALDQPNRPEAIRRLVKLALDKSDIS